MKGRSRLGAAMLVAVTLWSATALAGDQSWRRQGAGGWILRQVGLTDAQRTQIRTVLGNHRPQLRSLRQQLATAERDLRDRLYSDSNPPTVADLAPINNLRASLAQERLQTALDIRAVLTADQLAKASQLRQQMSQLEAQMRTLVGAGP